MVTNQSGIGRGFFSEELLTSIHGEFEAKLEKAGTGLNGIYYCPHKLATSASAANRRPACCDERVRVTSSISTSNARGSSATRSRTLEAGWAVGTRGALVRTGFGEGSLEFESKGWPRQPDLIADNVYRAIADIVWGSAR